MSAVMYVVLKSWVISTGVMFVNWGTTALLVRRLSRLESAGCAAEFWILPAMLSRRQTGGGGICRTDAEKMRQRKEKVQDLLLIYESDRGWAFLSFRWFLRASECGSGVFLDGCFSRAVWGCVLAASLSDQKNGGQVVYVSSMCVDVSFAGSRPRLKLSS